MVLVVRAARAKEACQLTKGRVIGQITAGNGTVHIRFSKKKT
jgi:hypothetical protein